MKREDRKELDCMREAFGNIPSLKRFEISDKNKSGFTASVELEGGCDFCIQAHTLRDAYPSSVIKALERREDDGRIHVLIAPYITDRTANLCREKGVGYFDYAGNCYFAERSVYLSERGHKNPEPEKKRFDSVFERSSAVSSSILRELFADPQKTWRQKHLSEKVGCSIGQVSKVMDFLIRNAWMEKSSAGYFLTNPAGLLLEWSHVYEKSQQISYNFYSLDGPAAIEAQLRDLKKQQHIDYFLTGFSGGVRYAPAVRYNRVHVYLSPKDIHETADFMDIREVSDGANLIIYPLDRDVYIRDSRIIGTDSVVSPVQIYLDCMQLSGRGEEMAEAVLKKEILR